MIAFDEIVGMVSQLSALERIRLVERIMESLEQDIQVESEPEESEDWHAFLLRTYGSLADFPMEIPEELPYEEREPLE